MSRFMTDEEIAAEQELIRRQQFTTLDDVRPTDLLHPGNYTDRATRDARYATCRACPELHGPTRTCGICHCFMAAKTWLSDARCALPDPDRKW